MLEWNVRVSVSLLLWLGKLAALLVRLASEECGLARGPGLGFGPRAWCPRAPPCLQWLPSSVSMFPGDLCPSSR